MLKIKNGNNEEITIRSADLDDASVIADMYSSISITKSNYKTLLAPGDESFSHRGGMFEISSFEDVSARLNDSNEFVVVGEHSGETIAQLWFGSLSESDFGDIIFDENTEAEQDLILRKRKDGTLGYAKEIISVSSTVHILPFALFAEMMKSFSERGVTHAIGEVFRVDGYDDFADGEHYDVELLNNASFKFLCASGGRKVGRSPQKKVTLDGYAAYITPYVFIWDTAESSQININILKDKGWYISNG